MTQTDTDHEQEKYVQVMVKCAGVVEQLVALGLQQSAEAVFAIHGFLPADIGKEEGEMVLACLLGGARAAQRIFGTYSFDTYMTVLGDVSPALFEGEGEDDGTTEEALAEAKEAVGKFFRLMSANMKKAVPQ